MMLSSSLRFFVNFFSRLLKYAQEVGFYKQTELCLPHKQANLLKLRREAWEAPVL